MTKTPKILFFLIASLLVGCNQVNKHSDANKLHGLWTLHNMEQQDPESGEWSEWRNGMQGYILYDGKGHMALHLTTKNYQNTGLKFPNFTDTISNEALRHLTNSYVYMARYTVNETDNIVEHARISHSNPGEWNDIVRRSFAFSGDTLILRPTEERNAGLRLKWIRSSVPVKEKSKASTDYLDFSNREDQFTGGIKMIPISTNQGDFKMFTKRVGNNPGMKVLLLHGGPGGTHEAFQCFDGYLPSEGIEYIYYDQLGSYYSDQPSDISLWTIDRYVEEVEQVRLALGLNADHFKYDVQYS